MVGTAMIHRLYRRMPQAASFTILWIAENHVGLGLGLDSITSEHSPADSNSMRTSAKNSSVGHVAAATFATEEK